MVRAKRKPKGSVLSNIQCPECDSKGRTLVYQQTRKGKVVVFHRCLACGHVEAFAGKRAE